MSVLVETVWVSLSNGSVTALSPSFCLCCFVSGPECRHANKKEKKRSQHSAFTTDGRKGGRGQQAKEEWDETEVREALVCPKAEHFLVCVFVLCCPSTSSPESAVYLECIWCLHACACVFAVMRPSECLSSCVCVCMSSGLEPQPPGEERQPRPTHLLHATLLCCFPSPLLSVFIL